MGVGVRDEEQRKGEKAEVQRKARRGEGHSLGHVLG